MGLVAEVELELRDAGLIKFFEQHIEAFRAMAATSYDYAASYVGPTGLPVRRDDVAASLVFALETNEMLRDYLATNHLRQKYQYRRFADLILDRLWEELHNEPEPEA
jgi:hypothetical protein